MKSIVSKIGIFDKINKISFINKRFENDVST